VKEKVFVIEVLQIFLVFPFYFCDRSVHFNDNRRNFRFKKKKKKKVLLST